MLNLVILLTGFPRRLQWMVPLTTPGNEAGTGKDQIGVIWKGLIGLEQLG